MDLNKEHTIEEFKDYTLKNNKAIKLHDGRIIAMGNVYKNEEIYLKNIAFYNKHFPKVLKFLRFFWLIPKYKK